MSETHTFRELGELKKAFEKEIHEVLNSYVSNLNGHEIIVDSIVSSVWQVYFNAMMLSLRFNDDSYEFIGRIENLIEFSSKYFRNQFRSNYRYWKEQLC